MKVMLFDGICNLCNNTVQFVVERDKDAQFKFAALQSDIGQTLLKQFKLPTTDFDSFVLVDGNKFYTKSSAALSVFTKLDAWYWKGMNIFWIVPKPIRDFVYTMIAKNRYRWFGKQDYCMMPTKELQERFLETKS